MRAFLFSFLVLGALSVPPATATAKHEDRGIEVTIEPTMQLFLSSKAVEFDVSVTNRLRKPIAFETCPDPYEIQITDRLANRFSSRFPDVKSTDGETVEIVDLPLCSRTFQVSIKPGETWTGIVPLEGGKVFDLKSPGVYIAQVRWLFETDTSKAGEVKITRVFSNQATFGIAVQP